VFDSARVAALGRVACSTCSFGLKADWCPEDCPHPCCWGVAVAIASLRPVWGSIASASSWWERWAQRGLPKDLIWRWLKTWFVLNSMAPGQAGGIAR